MKMIFAGFIGLVFLTFIIDATITFIKYKRFKKRIMTAKHVKVYCESIAQHGTGEYHYFDIVGVNNKTVMLSDGSSHAASYWIQDMFNQNFEIID